MREYLRRVHTALAYTLPYSITMGCALFFSPDLWERDPLSACILLTCGIVGLGLFINVFP